MQQGGSAMEHALRMIVLDCREMICKVGAEFAGSPRRWQIGGEGFPGPQKRGTRGTRFWGEWENSGVDREVHVPAGREAGATVAQRKLLLAEDGGPLTDGFA